MSKLKRDIILIGGFLLVAAILFLIFFANAQEGTEVVVKINNVEVARYSLSQDGEYSLNGGTNTLVIRDGKAWISYADCPDHRCVRQGKVKYNNQVIACRPNTLTVTVYSSEKQSSDVDLVS